MPPSPQCQMAIGERQIIVEQKCKATDLYVTKLIKPTNKKRKSTLIEILNIVVIINVLIKYKHFSLSNSLFFFARDLEYRISK